jgi:hypothetical protein
MLGRAHRVAPTAASVAGSTDGARVLFLCTPGDAEVVAQVKVIGAEHVLVPQYPTGDYARKINTGYRHTTEPLMFLGACDLSFHPGWLAEARKHLGPNIGVVGTNDLGNPRVIAGEHSTHSLVTRWYADRAGTVDGPGAILCETYPHDFVDDELVETAKYRQAYAHAALAIVEHLHPDWGKSPTDDLYVATGRKRNIGRRIFRQRRPRWTPAR